MCGIVADHGSPDVDAAERMLARLVHRGPDDEGSVRVNGTWLGHRRLSIVDVAGGHQPLTAETSSGKLHLVGNGEVYNHEEIRATLRDQSLSTRSDNEVALHLIAERGPDALSELLGMFAFVAAGEDGTFIAARDPVGIKPLYWAEHDGHMRFASELPPPAPERSRRFGGVRPDAAAPFWAPPPPARAPPMTLTSKRRPETSTA